MIKSSPESKRPRVASPVDLNLIAKKYEEEKKKKLMNMYQFHDPVAHIKSAGNGL